MHPLDLFDIFSSNTKPYRMGLLQRDARRSCMVLAAPSGDWHRQPHFSNKMPGAHGACCTERRLASPATLRILEDDHASSLGLPSRRLELLLRVGHKLLWEVEGSVRVIQHMLDLRHVGVVGLLFQPLVTFGFQVLVVLLERTCILDQVRPHLVICF